MMEAPDDSKKPLIRQIPQLSVASPSELRPRDPGNVQWYMPTWGETFRLMGWRCAYFLPAALLVIVLILLPWRLAWIMPFLVIGWKLVLVAVVLPTAHALKAAAQIIRLRKEPFCIHCGYDLTGHPDYGICPECGEPFTFRAIEEYRRDPRWFIKRYALRHEIPHADVPFSAGPLRLPRSKDGT